MDDMNRIIRVFTNFFDDIMALKRFAWLGCLLCSACPHGHKAGDADRWGTVALGRRPGNGEAALFLPCERGSHSHTVVITMPRLSLAL